MAALRQLHRQPGSGIYHQTPQPGTAQILINWAGAQDLQ